MIIRDPHPDMLSEAERETGCWVVNGDDLEPYDVILFLGEKVRIDRLTPAGTNALLESVYPEQDVRLIHANGTEWSWAVPSQMYRILPRPEAKQ